MNPKKFRRKIYVIGYLSDWEVYKILNKTEKNTHIIKTKKNDKN